MVSKGAFVIGLSLLLCIPAASSALPRSPINCELDRGSPVVDVAVQAPGAISSVRVFYRYEDGRDAYVDMVPVGGRYSARLPKPALGAGSLSYRVVAESAFTTRTGIPVVSSQLVAEAMGCGPTLRDRPPQPPPVTVAPVEPAPIVEPAPNQPAPPVAPAPPAPAPPVLTEPPQTPPVPVPPDIPPGPPTGGDPRSPPR